MAFSGGVCDTRCQNFFTTIIKNEDKARLRWFIKHRDQLLKNLENPKLIEKIKRDFSPEKKSKKSKQIREEKLKHVCIKVFFLYFRSDQNLIFYFCFRINYKL